MVAFPGKLMPAAGRVRGLLNDADTAAFDPAFTKRLVDAARPIAKRWFRFEVLGLESFPATGGALTVANHSGGRSGWVPNFSNPNSPSARR